MTNEQKTGIVKGCSNVERLKLPWRTSTCTISSN